MRQIKIDSVNCKFYQWGKNCSIIKLTEEEAIKNLKTQVMNQEEIDLFWYGYYYIG